MNKQLFIDICNRLETGVPALRWIDYDAGQLDHDNPPVAYPCCLIDISLPKCDDIGADRQQIVTANISLRLAFMPLGATNSAAPENIRAGALSMFDTIEAIHATLQEWNNNFSMEGLTRQSGQRENGYRDKRRDGISVYRLQYQTNYRDIPA